MFILDAPHVPPQYAPVMIAQAGSAQQQGEKNLDATIGVCMPIPSPVVMPESAEYQISPESAAATYFDRTEHIELYQYLRSATVTVVQQPKHGKLIGDSGSRYYPAAGYTGNDSITYLVELGGKRIKMVYFLQVVGQGAGNQNYYQGAGSNHDVCPKSQLFPWKISSITNANENPVSE